MHMHKTFELLSLDKLIEYLLSSRLSIILSNWTHLACFTCLSFKKKKEKKKKTTVFALIAHRRLRMFAVQNRFETPVSRTHSAIELPFLQVT